MVSTDEIMYNSLLCDTVQLNVTCLQILSSLFHYGVYVALVKWATLVFVKRDYIK